MSTTVANGIQQARKGVGVAGAGPRPGGSGAPRRRSGRGAKTLVFFALPSLILLLLINLYPLLYAGMQSLRQGNLLALGPWIGLKNYGNVLTAGWFWQGALFTLIFTIVGVFGSWIVGLLFALLLRTRIPAGPAFKVLLLLPWVVPTVVSATAWNWLMATPQSPVQLLIHALSGHYVYFLANPTLAKMTVCIFKVWISFPFMMMMMSSALAAVDTNVYEAAKVDGASSWQTFRSITMPLISRSTYISWILMTIWCVNDFPTIFLLTGGGPASATSTLIVTAYRTVFQNFDTGSGTAIAFLMTAVLVIVSVVLYRQIRKVNIE